MESIAAYGVNTVQTEPIVVRTSNRSETSVSPTHPVPISFDEQLAKAELAFWDDQLGSGQTGLTQLATEITHTLSGLKSLQLSMDQERQQVVVRVVDKETNKVVRQLPSRQMVDLVKQMRDLEGVLFKASS
ncbi:flagellar protein FlaG [Candidatus Magnetaquicoccus inordinatus]|uniref:flagellar protein FlaG n=1 Tax=Candidatus Magnetaquicoccus inordinatus TaxID=2496818 RepID=UPI00102D0B7B|nr:flagellar protein FlaG [Candidatus Magnetaquicoccus inordinatus]